MKNNISKKYFYNLNGLRFLLASLVLIHHVAIVTQLNGISNFYNKLNILKAFGPVAVSMFFTLSGFLITYFLLQERQKNGTISLKKFYLSRVLRILPLYYIIVIIHLYIIPLTPLHIIESKLVIGDLGIKNFTYLLPNGVVNLLYLLMLPQVALCLLVVFGASFIPASHVWSIGVEELFYLFWPILLLKFGHLFKKLIKYLFALYLLLMVGLIIVPLILKGQIVLNSKVETVLNFGGLMFMYNRIQCMFFGAVGAYILLNKPVLYNKLTQKGVFYISLFFTAIMFVAGIRMPFLSHDVYSILFTLIILFLIKNDKKYFLEHPILNYFGKISYGIYMYQMLAILITTYLHNVFKFHFLLIYVISFVITIGLASFSYELIEKQFLKLKMK